MANSYRLLEERGYRREDLTRNSQDILYWLDTMQERIENLKYDLNSMDEEIRDYSDRKNITLIGQLKKEYALKVMDFVLEKMEEFKADIQITLAENEQ